MQHVRPLGRPGRGLPSPPALELLPNTSLTFSSLHPLEAVAVQDALLTPDRRARAEALRKEPARKIEE